MKKIILDVGANIGQNVRKLRNVYGTDSIVYSFEPNPSCIKAYKDKWDDVENVHLIEKAASTVDGKQTFYLGKTTISSSLREDKKKSSMSGKSITVDTIDFSKWVKDNLEESDNIILYMDIEGAEYDVLDKLIEQDLLKWFNEVYMEFHETKLGTLDLNRHEEMYNKLIETYGDNIYIYSKHQHKKYMRIG